MKRAILFIGIAAAALGVAQPQFAAADPRHAPAPYAKGDQGGHKYLVRTHAKRRHHGRRLRKHRHCVDRHRRPYHTGYQHIRFSNGGSFAVVLSLGDTPYGYARQIRHRTRNCYTHRHPRWQRHDDGKHKGHDGHSRRHRRDHDRDDRDRD